MKTWTDYLLWWKGRVKANKAARVEGNEWKRLWGIGDEWARPVYGEYAATSSAVYSAVKVRSDAVGRVPFKVMSGDMPVADSHPLVKLLQGHGWYSGAELWRITEQNLCLWGSAFWAVADSDLGGKELWMLRPDRVRVLPSGSGGVKGYIYSSVGGDVAYVPEEIVWFRYNNPLEEFAGLSPMAPLRLSVDMGIDALKFNRNFFLNFAQPDVILTTEESMTTEEIDDFYRRWEQRYGGVSRAHRPAIASFIKDVKTLNISHREMEFTLGLRWALEEVGRVYGVPLPLLQDYNNAALANIKVSEQLFWRNTIFPELSFLSGEINHQLLPSLGYPNLRVEFDRSIVETMTKDIAAEVGMYATLLDKGVVTVEEVRLALGFPGMPEGVGVRPSVPSSVGEKPTQQSGKGLGGSEILVSGNGGSPRRL